MSRVRRWSITLALVAGLAAITIGVWSIYWPAGCIVLGLLVGFGALLIDFDGQPTARPQGVEIVDETESPPATIARIRG